MHKMSPVRRAVIALVAHDGAASSVMDACRYVAPTLAPVAAYRAMEQAEARGLVVRDWRGEPRYRWAIASLYLSTDGWRAYHSWLGAIGRDECGYPSCAVCRPVTCPHCGHRAGKRDVAGWYVHNAYVCPGRASARPAI